jgi:hypothetical protein
LRGAVTTKQSQSKIAMPLGLAMTTFYDLGYRLFNTLGYVKIRKPHVKAEAEETEAEEENRKLRYLRFLVDFSILSIQQDNLLLEQAQKLVEDVKRAACGLFPGKEETFELIYRPRFLRAIHERFGFILSEKPPFR